MGIFKEKLASQAKGLFAALALECKKETDKQQKIQYAGPVLGAPEYRYMMEAMLNNWWSGGKYTIEAEQKVARMCDRKYCVLVNSGSSANMLLLAAMQEMGYFSRGDKILTLACGFPTTVNPIIQLGMVPVFMDIDMDTLGVEPAVLESAIKRHRPKALFIAHTLGFPGKVREIKRIADKYNVHVIYDGCDSYGTVMGKRPLAASGLGSTLSFYVAHHLTMFEGGAIVCDDKALFNIVRGLRNWGKHCGSSKCCIRSLNRNAFCPAEKFSTQSCMPEDYMVKYQFEWIGYNLKPLELQSAVLSKQVARLKHFNARRVANYKLLYNYFKNKPGFRVWPLPAGVSPFSFPVLVDNRGALIKHLQDHDIESRVLFGGNLMRQPAYAKKPNLWIKHGDCPNSDLMLTRCLMLGVAPILSTAKIKKVIRCIDGYLNP